jgi:hypothetical protein
MEQVPPSDDAPPTEPSRVEASRGPRIVGPEDGKAVDLGSLSATRRSNSGPASPAEDRRLISEKVRSVVNDLFSTVLIKSGSPRFWAPFAGDLCAPTPRITCPKIARLVARRMPQMSCFSNSLRGTSRAKCLISAIYAPKTPGYP